MALPTVLWLLWVSVVRGASQTISDLLPLFVSGGHSSGCASHPHSGFFEFFSVELKKIVVLEDTFGFILFKSSKSKEFGRSIILLWDTSSVFLNDLLQSISG